MATCPWRHLKGAPLTGIFSGFYGKVISVVDVRCPDQGAISVLAIGAIFRRYAAV